MMIDRLSILALKIFHTRQETERASATELHRARNRERLSVLRVQADDLLGCVQDLFVALQAGTRRVKVYRQMKMYNDPELNPSIYSASESIVSPA